MSERVRVNEKVKVFIQKKASSTGLTEGEVVELEIFGILSKRR